MIMNFLPFYGKTTKNLILDLQTSSYFPSTYELVLSLFDQRYSMFYLAALCVTDGSISLTLPVFGLNIPVIKPSPR